MTIGFRSIGSSWWEDQQSSQPEKIWSKTCKGSMMNQVWKSNTSGAAKSAFDRRRNTPSNGDRSPSDFVIHSMQTASRSIIYSDKNRGFNGSYPLFIRTNDPWDVWGHFIYSSSLSLSDLGTSSWMTLVIFRDILPKLIVKNPLHEPFTQPVSIERRPALNGRKPVDLHFIAE